MGHGPRTGDIADQEIARGAERYLGVMLQVPVMVSLYAAEGELLLQSAAAAAAFRGRAGTLHAHLAAVGHAGRIWAALRSGGTYRVEAEVDTAAGRRWHQVDARPIGVGSGRDLVLITEHDVTEQHRSREVLGDTLLEHRMILENAQVGIIYAGGGRIRKCNRRIEDMFGHAPGGLEGRPFRELFPDAAAYRRSGHPGGRGRREVVQREKRMRRHDGSLFWCRISGKYIDAEDQAKGSIWVMEDISQRKEAEGSLRRTLLEMEVVLDNASVGIAFVRERRVQRSNRRLDEMFGFAPGRLAGHPTVELHRSPDDYHVLRLEANPVLARGEPFRTEYRMRRHDGTEFWCALTGKAIEAGDPAQGAIWILEDVTERRHAEETVRKTLHEQQLIVDNALVAILFIKDRVVQRCNRRFEDLLGYPPGGLEGRPTAVFYTSAEAWDELGRRGYPVLAAGQTFHTELELKRRDGVHIWFDVAAKAVDPADPGKGTIWIGFEITARKAAERALREAHEELELRVAERTRELNDAVRELHSEVAERRQAEERIRHLAHHDALTGLPNRTLLEDRLNQALSRSRRQRRNVAVLFIDLDRFKTINDSLGHYVGDRLLQKVVGRLQRSVRAEDTVARQGGDEFVIVLPNLRHRDDAGVVAGKILDALARPFSIEGQELHITPSIGVSVAPDDGGDAQTLMKNADMAMYHAKESGRNNHQFFTMRMNANAGERLSLENDLRRALQRDELALHYQPRVDLATGLVSGVEALLRWRHPDKGMVSPFKFIPVAEETGLILPLGDWVLQAACAQNRAWQDAGLGRLAMAVNVSVRQFMHQDLKGSVARALDASGLSPLDLELEITESMLMQNVEDVIGILGDFHEMGLQISIDDFGTGYSSLAYLKRLPLDHLKIDRSFVRDIPGDPDDVAIAQTVIAMAHSLNLTVIAEGAESAEQLAWLQDHGCDAYQGYYFSPPRPAAQLEPLLRRCAGRQSSR